MPATDVHIPSQNRRREGAWGRRHTRSRSQGRRCRTKPPSLVLSRAAFPKAGRASKQISTGSKTKPYPQAPSGAFHLPPHALLVVMLEVAIQETERKTSFLKEQARGREMMDR